MLPLLASALYLACICGTIQAAAAQLSSPVRKDSLVDCLRGNIAKSLIILPGDARFVNDSIRWTSLGAPSYSVLVNAGSVEDIANSIRCATQADVKFLATGPRHGYSITLGSVQNGLEINTAFLNHLSVDTEANTLTAGGAVTFGQAIDALYAVGKELPTGSCSCVGLLGGGLGGGVGRLSGLHGLVLDSILSVRLMLPNTTIVTASKDKNAELFWAIRGAGFNFGYVLDATFRIYDQVPNGLHLNADFKFPISQVQSYYERLAELSESLPKELSVLTLFNYDTDLNQTIITTNAVYAGPEAQGRAAVQVFLDQNPLVSNITAVPWNKLIDTVGFGFTGPAICKRGKRRSQWVVGVEKIDVDTYTQAASIFQDMITRYPATVDSSIDVQLLPTQGILAVPDDETAYPWRKLIAHVILEFTYTDAELDGVVDGYARRLRDVFVKTAGTDGLNAYVSYSHGDERLEEIYGERKLKRLVRVKREVDPRGLFDAYHPLPTAYP